MVVLFDVSGVLVDLAGGPTSLLPDAEDAWHVWGTSKAVRRFETGRSRPQQFANEMVREHALNLRPEELVSEFSSWPQGLFDGVPALIRDIRRRGVHVATLSNTNAIHWPYIHNYLGLGDVIECHFPSHETGVRKPEPQAFERVRSYFACSPADIVFLDDRDDNVTAAEAFGCRAATVAGIEEARLALQTLGVLRGPAARDRSRGAPTGAS